MMATIPLLLLRTTACTTAAGVLALLLLKKGRIQSPTVHRFASILVLLQGWIFFPIALQIPVAQPSSNVGTVGAVQVSEPIASYVTPDDRLHDSQTMNPAPMLKQYPILLGSVWGLGALVLVGRYVTRYVGLIHTLPLGETPTNPQWSAQWKRIARECCPNANPQFRITNDVGPLLSFVPFCYLILVPERLWATLDGVHRESILRHELAHITRHDLWKTAAVRFLALPQWFNPFAWQAVRTFDEAAEWACDEHVMNSLETSKRNAYPSALLQVAELGLTPLPSSLSARGGTLAIRVRRLVQPQFMEEKRMTKTVLLTLLLGIVALQSIRIETVTADEPTKVDSTESSTELTESRAKELAKHGIVPYRLAAPDVIKITARPNAENEFQSSDLGLPGEHLVEPNGTVRLGQFGEIRVHDMTLSDVENDIKRRLGVDVSVELLHQNSRVFYVVYLGFPDDGHVVRIPCSPDSDVRKVLTMAPPKSVDLAKANIWVSRPQEPGTKDKIIPVEWDDVATNQSAKSNVPLLPMDRVFVSKEPQLKVNSGTPAIPVGASNYSGEPNSQTERTETDPHHTNVKLNVRILSDNHGNLSEYDSFKNGPVMLADAKQIAATLRILEKNKLIGTLAAPAITCKSGQQVTLTTDGLGLAVIAHVTSTRFVRVETKIHYQRDGEHDVILDMASDVPLGNTVLMQAIPASGSAAESDDFVYLAITPEIVR